MHQEVLRIPSRQGFEIIEAVECRTCGKLIGLQDCQTGSRVEKLAWYDPYQSAYVCEEHLSPLRMLDLHKMREAARLKP